ncbi:hypothetical protein AX15_007911 [Amanita polypyramis BW_CC]|nr:hypothetical protein AX15_007911 [Amanita polypyramis BW_CC]
MASILKGCNQMQRGEVRASANRAPGFARPADVGSVTPLAAGGAKGGGLINDPGLSVVEGTRQWKGPASRRPHRKQGPNEFWGGNEADGLPVRMGSEGGQEVLVGDRGPVGVDGGDVGELEAGRGGPIGHLSARAIARVNSSLKALEVRESEGVPEYEGPIPMEGH